MATPALDPDHIRSALLALPRWTFADDALLRSYHFADFRTAVDFMLGCMDEIERMEHHPEWTNVFDRVSIRLRTHDAGDRVTIKDIELAKVLEWQANAYGAS
ncbi:MAG: 4a-hydroxytetrahydrobiopterin dehydratase [Planctomycetes bacterium]|nr:4a-hydroxytetrahydrobiopterin dehydratase [Planctomycetota bacterium]